MAALTRLPEPENVRMAAQEVGIDAHELETVRPYLLRFARLQLRDEALAEDTVSETVLAALVASGYVSTCYFPGHVEYVLTDLGLACLAGVDAAAVQRAPGETSATAPDSAVSPAQYG